MPAQNATPFKKPNKVGLGNIARMKYWVECGMLTCRRGSPAKHARESALIFKTRHDSHAKMLWEENI